LLATELPTEKDWRALAERTSGFRNLKRTTKRPKLGAKLTSKSHLALSIVSPSTENQLVSILLKKYENVRGSRKAQKSAKNHDSERKVFFVKADKVERLYCLTT
jgi:hypothetical protein